MNGGTLAFLAATIVIVVGGALFGERIAGRRRSAR